MTFWETIQGGEYVMFALAVIFIATVCIWCVTAKRFKDNSKSYPAIMHRVRDHITEGDVENADQCCGASHSPGARVLEAGLAHVGKPIAEVRHSMRQAAEIEKIKSGVPALWLKAFTVISPLAGLGGSLVGAADRLRDLGETGTKIDISAVCAAVAPTLVTAAVGMGVGIFAMAALLCVASFVKKAAVKILVLEDEFISLLNQPS